MIIRNLSIKDLEKMIFLENETWPEGTRAHENCFKSRIEIFPQGVIGSVFEQDIAGLSTSMIIDINDIDNIKSWEDITDYGMITSHNEKGNCLYVVSLGVSPRYQGKGVGQGLIKKQIELAKNLDLEYIVLGSRVPGFHTFNGTIEEYLIRKNEEGYSIDSLVRFYQKSGLEIGSIKINYMEDDKESRNYGLIMYKKLK